MFQKLQANSAFYMTCALTALLCFSAADAKAGTIAESVAQALKSHPTIEASNAAIEAAQDTVKEKRSGFFPTVSVNGKAGRMHANDDTTRAMTPKRGADQSWVGEAGITLNQPLFDGFGTWNNYDAAKERLNATEFDADSKSEDLALKAVRAHLNIMRTRELLTAAERYMKDIKKNKESIALLVKSGAADAAEQLQADQIMMSVEATKLGYDELFHRAQADYAEAVGQQPDGALKIGDINVDAFLPKLPDDAVAAAKKQHPQVKSAGEQAAAYDREAKAERATAMPRVDAELSWLKRDQGDTVGGEAVNGQAMLRLTWGLETGGGQFARTARDLRQRDMALANQRETVRNLERDIRQKYVSLETAEKQLAILGEREKANEKILENYKAQFQGGNRSILQLISAQNSLFESSAARIDAYYRRQLGRLEVLQAMGILRDALGVTTKTAALAR